MTCSKPISCFCCICDIIVNLLILLLYVGSCWTGWFECVKQNLININSYKTVIPATCLPPPNAAFTIRAMLAYNDEDIVGDEQCFYVTSKIQLRPKIRYE